MRLRVLVPLTVAAVGIVASAVATLGLFSLATASGPVEALVPRIGTLASVGFLVAAAAIAAGAFVLHRKLVVPIETLTSEVRTLTRTPQERALLVPPGHALERLPDAVEQLLGTLASARRETRTAIAAATARAEEQKSRLEAILLDLTEGVVVCNLDHRILLYNQAAQRLVRPVGALGLDRALFAVLTREPVLYALDQLMAHAEPAAGDNAPRPGSGIHRFVCATVEPGALLEARLSLVREAAGEVSGYVLTFADVSQQLENLAARDSILREIAVDWRRPLASLGAATEALQAGDDLAPEERHAFERIVGAEVTTLSERLADIIRRYDKLASGHWPMSDMRSLDLFRVVERDLGESAGIALTPVGVPIWLQADSHSLMLGLKHLVQSAARHTGCATFDIAAQPGSPYAYLELTWDGQPVPAAAIEGWLDEPLVGSVGARTLRQIVERHGGDLWSRTAEDGRACLRFPLRQAERPKGAETIVGKNAPRPEYYDFDLFKRARTAPGDARLRSMRFVVFDTETTGLEPARGDEIISIGAVRVVNGRLLTGETFERLVNPQRPIPPASVKFHGIVDEMVKDKPPARIVLPQFKTFAGDAVLVAYNIAFDMAFLAKRQDEAGVVFDNPVLDALLLTAHLHKDMEDHSLSAMAQRLGIDIVGRHTALGDAMATAALWVRLIDLMEERGIATFAQAAEISNRMMRERRAKTESAGAGW